MRVERRRFTIFLLLMPSRRNRRTGGWQPASWTRRVRGIVERIRSAFPDINIVVEDVFGAEDKVVLRWSATMTHRGDHLGMPATGERVRITGMTIARIGDKQIIEGWDNWDQLGMLKQIGAYQSSQTTLLKSA
jgi:steroid delta-isomerase-like uncharacterized protein